MVKKYELNVMVWLAISFNEQKLVPFLRDYRSEENFYFDRTWLHRIIHKNG